MKIENNETTVRVFSIGAIVVIVLIGFIAMMFEKYSKLEYETRNIAIQHGLQQCLEKNGGFVATIWKKECSKTDN
jgi:hypothetical protein